MNNEYVNKVIKMRSRKYEKKGRLNNVIMWKVKVVWI